MKMPVLKPYPIIIISILILLGIAGRGLIYGIPFPSNENNLTNTSGTGNPPLSLHNEIGVHFEIYEWNLSIAKNRTIIHVTDEELKGVPDIMKSMQELNSNSEVWDHGQRFVKEFDGNFSDLDRFNLAVCKNRTLDICYANPPLFEYQGRYYYVSSDYIGAYHRLAGCERGNYYCTTHPGN